MKGKPSLPRRLVGRRGQVADPDLRGISQTPAELRDPLAPPAAARYGVRGGSRRQASRASRRRLEAAWEEQEPS